MQPRRTVLLGILGAASTAAISGVLRGETRSGSRAGATINLLGDCIMTTPLPREDADLNRIGAMLQTADLTVANFEGTLADAGAWANSIDPHGVPVCGGQNIRGVESTIDDLGWLGVRLVGTANNHGMDWGAAGLLTTVRKLDQAGIAHAGTGADLAAAREPGYAHSAAGTVALISCASTYWPGALASHANAEVPGRPGISPLRIRKREGVDEVDPRDLDEIVASIRKVKQSADVTIISCHTHEEGENRALPPAFLEAFAHACIDAGAHAFFSHGPHVLRGVEIYRNRPIFYSLGAFLFLTRDLRQLPEEVYESCGMASRNPLDYYALTDKEFIDDTEFWQGAVAQITVSRGQIQKVDLVPIVIRHSVPAPWGVPRLASRDECSQILLRLQSLSRKWNTSIVMDYPVGRISI
jgi:hypothetical protein